MPLWPVGNLPPRDTAQIGSDQVADRSHNGTHDPFIGFVSTQVEMKTLISTPEKCTPNCWDSTARQAGRFSLSDHKLLMR